MFKKIMRDLKTIFKKCFIAVLTLKSCLWKIYEISLFFICVLSQILRLKIYNKKAKSLIKKFSGKLENPK